MVVLFALLAAPASAGADATINAIPFDSYDAAEYTIDAGEKVTFTNYDFSNHDVVGQGFKSALIGPTQSAPVEGADALAPGRYPFVCSIHANMKATLVVRGSEPPPPEPPPSNPEAPPGQPEPPAGQASDTEAPGLKLRLRRDGRDVVARIGVDEAAEINIRAGGDRRSRGVSGARTFNVRYRRRANRQFRVTVTARDSSGNESGISRRWRPRR